MRGVTPVSGRAASVEDDCPVLASRRTPGPPPFRVRSFLPCPTVPTLECPVPLFAQPVLFSDHVFFSPLLLLCLFFFLLVFLGDCWDRFYGFSSPFF